MRHFAHLLHDPARLAALRRTALLDQPASDAFDRLTRLAKQVLDVPVTLLTLVDDRRQFFASFVGLPEPWASRRETPLSHSFCQYTVRLGEPFVVENARDDPLVCSNLAIGDLGVVAYAGVPVADADGHPLGSFAAADTEPRSWTAAEIERLRDFAALASAVMTELTAKVQAAIAHDRVAKLAAVFETTSDLVGATTPGGRILYLNRAAREALGVGLEEDLAGTPLAELLTPEGWRQLRDEGIPQAIRTGSWQEEVAIAPRTAAPLPVVLSITAHRGSERDQGFLSFAARDITREREARLALQETEQLVHSIISSAGEGIVVYDRELRYLLWNPVMERLTGMSADRVLGRPALEIFPFLRKAGVADLLTRALQGEPGRTPDLPYIVPGTGEQRWTTSYHSPLRSTRGEILGVVSIVHDVTDRKHAERALRASEQRYRTLVETISEITWVIDQGGEFTEEQPGWSAFAGMEVRQLRGEGWLEAIHPADRERARREWLRAFQTGTPYAVQYRLRRADGEFRQMQVRAAPILDAQGRVREWVGIHQDATEQVAAQEQIALLARERAAVLGQIADGVIVTDREGRITFVNDAARRIHGASLDDPVERYSDAYQPFTLSGEPFPTDEMPLARAVRNGEVVRDVRWLIRRPNGAMVVVEGSASPVIGDGGARVAAVLTLRDITERVRAEEERAALLRREREARASAEQANRAKSDFLAVVSHELRTPLAAAISFAELLEAEVSGALEPRQREYVQRISESAWHLTHLVDEILEYTRMESGQLRIHRAQVDAGATASAAMDSVRQVAASKGLAVEVSAPAQPVLLESDPHRIHQILSNLLSNALKFTEQGTIRVEVEGTPDDVAFRVSDTGIGIAEEHQENVFSAFWQVESPLTRRTGGTGLGLSIVRRLARLLGGDVEVRSAAGAGSTFTLTLPRRPPLDMDRPLDQ